jgi:hypothetical protein
VTVQFHFLDALGEISARLLDPVRLEMDKARETVLRLLPIDRVDIVVVPGPWVIPEFGLTGATHGKARITITIDPDSPRLHDAEREQRILGVVAHELHHVARARGPGYGRTLGEALVSEGLAQCFEVEAGAPIPFYATSLPTDVLRQMEERAREQAFAREYEHGAWFFGKRDDPSWPRNAGYSLGFSLVESWMREQGTTAVASVAIPADTVLSAWMAGAISIRHPVR